MDIDNITQAQIDRAVKRLEGEKRAILANRSFYKWLFDILRNCMENNAAGTQGRHGQRVV